MISRALEDHGLEPGDLMLEIGEPVLAGEAARAVAAVRALAALGVAISIDDFGTGLSSPVRLKRLPVSEIKVDPPFITTLRDVPGHKLIVSSLVGLVRALGIRSVAEGVETPEVAAALTAMGCDAAQGWCFSRPLDPAAATRWLTSNRVVPAGRGLPERVPAASRKATSMIMKDFPTIRGTGFQDHGGSTRGRRARGAGGGGCCGAVKRSAGWRAAPRIATMPIARDDVAHLARLSRLALAEDELDHLAAQLDVIIAAVARVQEVAADGIPPTSHAVPLVNVFRDDVVAECLTAEAALSQAPAVEEQRFRVPRILAED
jgi:aspartyl/glutamyl-tRNA(Asn/Gln) amidotransferase C subunit